MFKKNIIFVVILTITFLAAYYFFSIGHFSEKQDRVGVNIAPNHNIPEHKINPLEYDKEPSNPFDVVVSNLKEAHIAFNTPYVMKKGEASLIILKLSSIISKKYLADLIPGEQKETAKILHSNKMIAKLIGGSEKSFHITSITPDKQAVSNIYDETTWKWNVTPLESGDRYLHLTLTAILDVEGKETPYHIKTFDRKIKIEIIIVNEISNFIQNSWKWLLGSMLFPLIAWYWKLKKQKES